VARVIGILKNIVFGGRAQNFCRPLYLPHRMQQQSHLPLD
jgi:hypothetical protein